MRKYAVIGAGRQGVAVAYDLARFGDASEVRLLDLDLSVAVRASERVNKLLGRRVATFAYVDVGEPFSLIGPLKGVHTLLSAVPYHFNLNLTKVAIDLGLNMCDLGGETEVVLEQEKLNDRAQKAGVSIIPDCGMGPGMTISLALYAMSFLDKPREVYIWDGGLPQNPQPPLGYALLFNLEGLLNEYEGNAAFLRDGNRVEVPALSNLEELDIPPLGKLEAAVTSGQLSTMPWTFEGKLSRLEVKTLRYPGHWEKILACQGLGLFSGEEVTIGGVSIVPREVLKALLLDKLSQPNVRDVCVILVRAFGEKKGKDQKVEVKLIDWYDPETGFTAMERLTGWHASIVAILATQGKIQRGVIPIDRAVPGTVIVEEALKRKFKIKVSFSFPPH